jgi:hypothetical protein
VTALSLSTERIASSAASPAALAPMMTWCFFVALAGFVARAALAAGLLFFAFEVRAARFLDAVAMLVSLSPRKASQAALEDRHLIGRPEGGVELPQIVDVSPVDQNLDVPLEPSLAIEGCGECWADGTLQAGQETPDALSLDG